MNSLPRVRPSEREVNCLHVVPRYTVCAALTAQPYINYVGLPFSTYTMNRNLSEPRRGSGILVGKKYLTPSETRTTFP